MGYNITHANCAEEIFGPSVNAIIVDFMINSHEEVGRKEIEKYVKEYINKISTSNPEIKKRIPIGRESIIFWTDFLESNGVIKTTSKRPKKYILNPDYEGISAFVSLKNSFIHRRYSDDKVPLDATQELTFSLLKPDGTVRIRKEMRELQRRWRNTEREDYDFGKAKVGQTVVVDEFGVEIVVLGFEVYVEDTPVGVITGERVHPKQISEPKERDQSSE